MTAALILVLFAAAAASTVVMFFFNTTAGIVEAVVFGVLFAAVCYAYFSRTFYYKNVIEKANHYFDSNGGSQTYPIPTVVVGVDGAVIWYNKLFRKGIMSETMLQSGSITELIGDVDIASAAADHAPIEITFRDRKYAVYVGTIDQDTRSYCCFFFDNTELEYYAEEYRQTRPSVFLIKVDNLDDVYKTYRNSECEVISGEIETILENWAMGYPCVFRKISGGRFFMVIEESGLEKLIANKFDILKRIRDYRYSGNPMELTLSIGVGRGNTMRESEELASQALEMSQSRGGDQATIDRSGEFEFFGGTVGGTTKSSRVKARIMAISLSNYMLNSDIVFASGHAFSDLDSIGAAVGIFEMARALDRPCYILSDREKTMAGGLIDSVEKSLHRHLFIDADKALQLMRGKASLLVVVDTHRPNSVDFPELNDRFTSIAVIDHHRRTSNLFRNAVLFYDEPNSSSASEMVTELLQYTPAKVDLYPMSAEALLSGIMLDSRNFILGTGVRTFEAAAYLKSHGADTIAVKQLFANSMDNYKVKAAILSSAFNYKHCAIAVSGESADNMRMIASQVADDLMSVTDIKSSYVCFSENGMTCISARSLGEMNVQVIMEKLGGGGHFTMAATQLKGVSVEEAIEKLKAAITEYLEME